MSLMSAGMFQLVGVSGFCALDVHEHIKEKERGSCLFQTQIHTDTPTSFGVECLLRPIGVQVTQIYGSSGVKVFVYL